MSEGPAESSDKFRMFDEAIQTGRAILIVGDQFLGEEGAVSLEPTFVDSVRALLAKAANAAGDPSSNNLSLQQLKTMADSASPSDALAAVRECITASVLSPEDWISLLQAPWQRIYDLTGATLSLEAQHGLPTIDAVQQSELDRRITQVVNFAGVGDGTDYSVPTGQRSVPRDTWFRQFCADIVSNPVVVIAAQTHPELWNFFGVRSGGSESGISPAVMICEQFSASDRALSNLHHVDLQAAALQEVVSECSRIDGTGLAEGRRRLAQARESHVSPAKSLLVSRLLGEASEIPPWRFLRGYDPNWSDIASGRAVRLSRLKQVYEKVRLDEQRRNIVIVKGRAGSGKTALLMRMAYELHAKGRTVVWLDRSLDAKISEIVERVNQLSPDVVMVDDINVFGDAADTLLYRLNRGGKSAVVASVRRTQIWALEGAQFATVDGDADLSNNDLEGLIRALTDAGLLGVLQGRSPASRLDFLRRVCRRDLLAALIEVVTGEPFEDRIASEYEELGPYEKGLYTAVCLAEHIHETEAIAEEDILQAAGDIHDYARFREAAVNLIQTHRLVLRIDGGLVARHRAIADAVVKALGPSTVSDYVKRMLSMYASRAANTRDQSNPDRRLLVHLLSHSRMVRLRVGKSDVREIYESVQDSLAEDFHFWLQRGAYEVEEGELDLAETYLKSARSLPGGLQDRLVTTEWGFMRLRRAVRRPESVPDAEKAGEAMDELIAVTREAGSSSPHTFSVIIQHGTDWLRSSTSLQEAQVIRIARKIEATIDLAETVCASNREIARTITTSRPVILELLGDRETGTRYPL